MPWNSCRSDGRKTSAIHETLAVPQVDVVAWETCIARISQMRSHRGSGGVGGSHQRVDAKTGHVNGSPTGILKVQSIWHSP